MSGLARAAVGVVGFIVALVGLGMLGFTYFLARGPIDLDSLKPTLLAALQERLGDRYRVSLASTYLVRPSNGFGLGFGFSGIRIDDAQGHELLFAPDGRLSLDLLALMDFKIHVRRVQIEHLVLNMRIRADGQWEIGAGLPEDAATTVVERPANEPKGAPFAPETAIAGAISALAGEQQPLDHVAIADGRLRVVNQAIGRTIIFENFAFAYDRHNESADASVTARGPAGVWNVVASASFGRERRLSVEAKDLSVDDLMLFASGKPGFFTDMPLTVRLKAALDEKGGLANLDAGLGFGAGFFKLDDPDFEPILMDEATAELAYDRAKGQFRVTTLEALNGSTHFQFSGDVAPPSANGEPWAAHLESHDSVLAPERPGSAEVVFDKVNLDAHVYPEAGRFVLDKAEIHGPKITGEMSAELLQQADGPELKLNLNVGRSDLRSILRVWPQFINPDARKWCDEHIHAGALGAATMRLDWNAADLQAMHEKRAVPADSFRGDFTFVGASTDVLDGLPQLTGLDATGSITGRVFDIRAEHGVMAFPSGRKLDASEVYFRVPDTAPAAIVAGEGGAHVTAAADAVAELLGQEAIRKFAGLSLDPATVKGQAQGQLTLSLAMGKTAKPQDQKFQVAGTLSALQLDKYAGNSRFEQGALDFSADSSALKASGSGLLDGVPAKVDLAKNATDDGAVNVALTLDDQMRSKLGLNFGPPMTGVMTVKLKAGFGTSSADAEADLSKVDITNFDGGSLKPAGRPGKATFTLKSAPDGVAVNTIAVDAGPILARGTAQFSSDGTLQNAKLSQLKFAPTDALTLDIAGGSPIKATLRGASLDGRALIKSFLSRDAGSNALKDLDVDAKVSSVQGMNATALADADFTLNRRGGTTRGLTATGRLGEGQLEARMDEGALMRIRTSDAGAFARFFDIYQHLQGGSLDLSMREESDGGHGQALLRRFALVNETALTKMEAAAPNRQAQSRGGGGEAPSAVEPGITRFDKMTATFVRNAGRIEITDMAVNSASQGLTLQGMIDFAKDRLDISGVYVPAYGVNSLVNHIPVVGAFLGGGQNEGVFSVNFRVSGALTSPTLTFNPLSGVAPGIFRKMFGVFDGTIGGPTRTAPDD